MTFLSVDEMVLMIKKTERQNDPNSGFFTLPGGNLKNFERGANPTGRLESAIREIEEESGLTLIKPVLRGVILFDNAGRVFDNWPNPQDFLVSIFSARQYSGRLKTKTREGIPLWIAEKDIGGLPKNPGDAKMYEWLKDPRYFMGVIRHNERELDESGTFVDYFYP